MSLTVVGTTVDGRSVVAGVYRVVETHGTPLEDVLDRIRSFGHLPCWLSYYREAIAAGMKHDRILARLDPAIVDSFGVEMRDHVIATLERIHTLTAPIFAPLTTMTNEEIDKLLKERRRR